ncbi:MAG: YidB family protein [Candidatus Acidiferrum sp.]|jgi:uncharacterized protein YidB (DUF937 family)
MGIFDDVEAMAGLGGSAAGEVHPGALAAVMEYVNSPQVGGVSGLQKMFEEKGLGGLVSSWVGNGQNLPISSDQLQSVLHSDALNQAAAKFGVDPSQLTSMMSHLLPHVVDKMTPNDQAAAAGQ